MKWIETNNDTEVETDVYSEREAFFEFMLPMLGFFFALTFILYFLHSYTTSGKPKSISLLFLFTLEKLEKIKAVLSPKASQKVPNGRCSTLPIVNTPALK